MKEFLHFTAIWCNPCKMMAPIIERFISENPDIKYTKIDTDDQPLLVNEYAIQSIPTFIAVVDGEIHNRLSGIKRESDIKSIFG